MKAIIPLIIWLIIYALGCASLGLIGRVIGPISILGVLSWIIIHIIVIFKITKNFA